ncbi:hypothetical protein KFU94_41640 [Chloroflexi bacterium TSY]|nr:hypothetical protein [Chloroflexi bacterium TSY]
MLEWVNNIISDNAILQIGLSGFGVAIVIGLWTWLRRRKSTTTFDNLRSTSQLPPQPSGDGNSSVNIGNVDGGIHNSTISGRDVNQTNIKSSVNAEGDFVKGDKPVQGDDIGGDKISVGRITDEARVAIGRKANITYTDKSNKVDQAQRNIIPREFKRDEQ